MLKSRIVFLAVTLLTSWSLLAQQTVAVLAAPAAPVIDGVLQEDVWQHPPQFPRFRPLGQKGAADGESLTRAWLAADQDALYVAAWCYEPNMVMLVTGGKKQDDPVWQDDCMEIFLDVAGQREGFVQIVISAAGVIMDAQTSARNRPPDLHWDAQARSAVTRHDDGWTLEARIPFDRLPIQDPQARWNVHIARHRAHTGENFTSLEGPATSNSDLEHFAVLTGLAVPKMMVTVLDYTFGEGMVGRNRALFRLKNWSERTEKVGVSWGWDDAKNREERLLNMAPGSTETVEVFWELTAADRNRTQRVDLLLNKQLLRRIKHTFDQLPDIFADRRQIAYPFSQNAPVLFDIPVNITALSRENASVFWTLHDAAGRQVSSGQSRLAGPVARLRLYWTFPAEGVYSLNLKLADPERVWQEFSRPVHFVRSVWEP